MAECEPLGHLRGSNADGKALALNGFGLQMSDQLEEISRLLRNVNEGVPELYKEVIGTREEVAALAKQLNDLASQRDIDRVESGICEIQSSLIEVSQTAYGNGSKIEDLAETVRYIRQD